MRILSLHIENFGTLHAHEERFDQGLNVRLYPNGWGKSTLAVFIKAMLFGLPASTRRSLIENERKRYTPWQGGTYGGSLDIEVEGEPFRIERTFGTKESDDTLRVIDLNTGREATHHWAADPGPMLFGVDAGAYERSTYLSQRPTDAKDGAVGIHTKLNRLVDATDDIANYDTAIAALDKRRQYYRLLKGEGGAIFQNQQRLQATERALEQALSHLHALSECRARIAQRKQALSQLRRELALVEQSERQLHRRGELQAVNERLLALRREVAGEDEALRRLRAELGNPLPDDTTLERLSSLVEREEQARRALDRLEADADVYAEYDELCRTLGPNVPSDQAKNTLRAAARDYHTALGRIDQQDLSFVEDALAHTPEEQLALTRRLIGERAKQDARPLAPATALALLLGAGTSLALLALGALVWPYLLIAGALSSAATLFGLWRQRQRAAEIALAASQEQQKRGELLLELSAARLAFHQAIGALSVTLSIPRAEDVYWYTEQLITKYERLEALCRSIGQKTQERARVNAELEQTEQAIRALLAPVPAAPANGREALSFLRGKLDVLREVSDRHTRKSEELEQLCRQYADEQQELEQLPHGQANATALEDERRSLALRRQTLTAQLDELTVAVSAEEQLAIRLESSTEELDALESERGSLSLLIEQQESSLGAIVLAEKYLAQARENLSVRYLKKMKERFAVYMEELTGQPSPDFTMDTQFRTKLSVMGAGRDTDSFSVGWRDLISLCERLSLVDAMFEGERPFLILDDPFTNLDDTTLARAQNLLETLSERYQLLYLSCHSGRVAKSS